MTDNNNLFVTPETEKVENEQPVEQVTAEQTATEPIPAEQPAEQAAPQPAAEPTAEPPVEQAVQQTAPSVETVQSSAERTAKVPQLTFEAELPPIPEPEVPDFRRPAQQGAPNAQTGQPTHTVPQYGAQYQQQNQAQYQNPQQYQQPANNFQQNYRPVYDVPPEGYTQKSRLAAAVLAFQFGIFGVHNFYLGNTGKAVLQLILTIIGLFIWVPLVATLVWAFIEGIMIISSPNALYDANGVIMRQ